MSTTDIVFDDSALKSSTHQEPNAAALECKLCQEPITMNSVKCPGCSFYFHSECVPDSSQDNWNCSSCSSVASKKCYECKLPISKEYQQCLKCRNIFHNACVQIERSSAADLWICKRCNVKVSAHSQKSDSKKSKKSSSSRRSSTFSLNLDLLEEESKLVEEIAKKKSEMLRQEEELLMKKKALILEEEEQRKSILRKKQELLENASISSSSSRSTSVNSSQKAKNTEAWLSKLKETDGSKKMTVNLNPEATSFRPLTRVVDPSAAKLPGVITQRLPLRSSQCIPKATDDHVLANHHLTKSNIQARHATKELPTFSGDSADWPLFVSAFEMTTVQCNYSNYENQQRLLTCLKGQARSRVGPMLTYPDNVPFVIDRLRKWYGQPHQIIAALTKKVRDVPKVRLDKLQTLVDLQTAVMQLCSNIYAANINEHLSNPSLVMEIAEKLPPELKLQWGERMEEVGNANLEILDEWLSFKADSACRVMFSSKSCDDIESKPKKASYVLTHSEHKEERCLRCDGACKGLVKCVQFNTDQVSDRWKFVKSKYLCFRCLEPHRSCKTKSLCGVSGCHKKHHQLLHEFTETPETVATVSQEHRSVLFRIVPVKLYGSNCEVSTFAFLDEGSSVTLIDDELMEEISPNAINKPLCMFWTGKKSHMENRSRMATVGISGDDDGSKIFSISVRSLSNLSLPTQTLSADFIKRFEHLKNLPIRPYYKAIPKVLIGMDNWRLTIPRKLKEEYPSNGIAATNTLLGWVVQGQQNEQLPESENNSLHVHMCNCRLNDLMEKHYSLENFGVVNTEDSLLSSDDKKALELLEIQTTFSNGCYSTGLLWKPIKFNVPNSRTVSINRLQCLEKRMAFNPELRSKMLDEISTYQQKGYIRKLSNEELSRDFNRKWYLPIFPVFNKNKPDKFRIVWDAAAETNGISLNKMQYKGPDLVPLLVGVLLRFREGKYGVSADIAEMFHMIKINPEDHHSQRFLWRDSPNLPIDEYVMQVMTFGSCSSPCTAQFIKNRNAEKYSKEFPKAVEAIVRDHYVDDFLGSYSSESEAIDVCQQVSKIHSAGGFHIRNWISNSTKLLRVMSTSAKVKGLDIQGDSSFKEKILGMWWVPERDVFTFKLRIDEQNVEILSGKKCPTKRELLSVLMKVYDPLGLINHFLIFAKILLQRAWLAEIEWDVSIGEELFTMWLKWLTVLRSIDGLEIPRWHYVEQTVGPIELHIFCDASKDAYSAVGYFRFKLGDNYRCSLVTSKSRVAPKRIISIPRLELLAAVLGVRLADVIKTEHSVKIDRVIFWSDSKSVVYWIQDTSKAFKQFVAFRINEIREKSKPNMWRFVPGRKNVADLSTKWSKVPTLTYDNPWFIGPDFLYYEEEHWEVEPVSEPEDKLELCFCINSRTNRTTVDVKIDVNRFSKWRKLLGAVSFMLRAVTPGHLRPKGPLLQSELQKAEMFIIRQAQTDSYNKELTTLMENDSIDQNSRILFLSPFLDKEGVLRAYGRLEYAECLDHETKRPIILPHNHRVSFLLIDHYHRLYDHLHDNTVVNEINQHYYVHKLRIALRSVRSRCQFCKNKNAKPTAPLMSDLPPARLQAFTRPFSFMGMDYFGPMTIVIGRKCSKRWGVLMTCLTTRAIHIELAASLSSDSCIMALHRFIGRRGTPIEIYTDNATNFHGVETELFQVLKGLNRDALVGEFQGSKWCFIPPSSPHMGGCWERMIRSVKNVLYQILPTTRPSHELLLTILIHIENMVNSRPLYYVPVEHNAREAITPNHFLLGSSNGIKPCGQFTDEKVVLRKNWMEAEKYANLCWRRFIKEFLPTLTGRSKWCARPKPIEVGDVVVIVDENNPRNSYPKGIVIETNIGKNDQVRSAKVQTQTGIYTRPAVKLAVLDVMDCGGSKGTKDLPTAVEC